MKRYAVLLTVLTLVFQLLPTAVSYAAAAEIAVFAAAGGAVMPVGSKTRITAKLTGADAEKVEFLSAYDGGSYETLGTVTDMNNISVTAEYEEYEKNIIARAYDLDGMLIAESEPVTLKGMREIVERQVWDEDFEGAEAPEGRGANLSRGGAAIRNSDGSALAFNRYVGSNADTWGEIEVEPDPSGTNGDSVRLTSKAGSVGDDTAQFNALWTTIRSNTAVLEMDYMFEDFNISPDVPKVLMQLNAERENNGAWISETVTLNDLGEIVFANGKKKVEVNKWYTVTAMLELESGRLTVLVDGEFLASTVVGKTIKVNRLCINNRNTATTMWIDNYNARETTYINASEKQFAVLPTGNTTGLYMGEKLNLKIDMNGYRNARTVNILSSADGESYGTAVSQSASLNSAAVEILGEKTYIKAQLLADNGEILSETAPVVITAKSVLVIERLWDVNFETNGFRTRDGKEPMSSQVVTASDGSDLSAKNGERLECERGTQDNIMRIEQYERNLATSKGVRVELADSGTESSFSSWAAVINDNTALFEMDYCVLKEAAETWLMKIDVKNTAGAASQAASVAARNGKLVLIDGTNGSAAVAEYPYETGEWYNIKLYIDISDNKARLSIDDVYVGEFGFSAAFGRAAETRRMMMSLSGAEGSAILADNFKVCQLWVKPDIVSAELSDDYSADVRLDGAIAKSMISGVELSYGENRAAIKEYSVNADKNTLHITSYNKIYTAVPVDCKIKLTDGGEIAGKFTLDASAFDITNVSFGKNGAGVSASADIVNNTQQDRSVVMIMGVYNDKDEIIGTCAKTYDIAAGAQTEATLSSDLALAYAKVFFINGWTEGAAAKCLNYISKN